MKFSKFLKKIWERGIGWVKIGLGEIFSKINLNNNFFRRGGGGEDHGRDEIKN